MTQIKREKYKNKYYVVIRDEKGRILSRRQWKHSFKLEQATSKFKEDKTLTEGVKKFKLTKVVEITDYRERKRRPYGRVQYVIEGRLPNGTTIAARSQSHPQDYPKRLMREEALESFRERVAQAFGKEYDEDIGAKIIEEHRIRIREGFVYYKAVV